MFESLTIQNLIVALVVLTAVIGLVLRASKYFLPAKTGSGCASGCGGCASRTDEPATPRLIQLGGKVEK